MDTFRRSLRHKKRHRLRNVFRKISSFMYKVRRLFKALYKLAYRFVKTHLLISAGAFVVFIGIIVGMVFLFGGTANTGANVDEDTLNGLTGEGLTDDDYYTSDDVLDQNVIGVIMEEMTSDKARIIIQGLEELSNEAIGAGQITSVRFYDASQDKNQQMQYLRSMINSGVKVVILYMSDEETFKTMASLAKDSDIYVVSIDAPVKSGYDVNIVSDLGNYGKQSAQVIISNAQSGNMLPIVENDISDIGQKRLNNILNLSTSSERIKLPQVSTTANNAASDFNSALTSAEGEQPKTAEIIISGISISKQVLNAAINANKLPRVFVGGASAGFIKLWYTLKTSGVSVTTMDETTQQNVTITLTQGADNLIFAEIAPQASGDAALRFALRFAQGKILKADVLEDNTYYLNEFTLIDDNTLSTYYEMVKDKDDSYMLTNSVDDGTVDSFFEDAPEASAQQSMDPSLMQD